MGGRVAESACSKLTAPHPDGIETRSKPDCMLIVCVMNVMIAVNDHLFDRLVETSLRISNQSDIATDLQSQFAGYTHVDASYPINWDDRCKPNLVCCHSLETYLNTLDVTSVALDPACAP